MEENHYINSDIMNIILERIFQENIIDEKELGEIECQTELEDRKLALYSLMENMDCRSSLRILQLIKYVTTEENRINANTSHPLLINQVVQCVVSHLSFSDIKSCRQVCQKWKCIATPLMTEHSKIVFKEQMRVCGEIQSRTVKDFMELFPTPLEQISDFTFAHSRNCSIEDLSKFFLQYGKAIKNFRYNTPTLTENGIRLEKYDITPILQGSNIAEIMIRQLKVSENDTSLTISLDALPNLKKLGLVQCLIKSQVRRKLRPRNIYLQNVRILGKKKELKEFFITDLIDFSNAKYVAIDCSGSKCVLKLNLERPAKQNVVSIDSVILNRVKLLNPNKCTWTINNLALKNVDLLEKCHWGMNVKSLKVFGHKTIDLMSLPPQLQWLSFYDKTIKIVCVENVYLFLPHLTRLHLDGNIKFFPCFANCLDLTEISLVGDDDDINAVDKYAIYVEKIPAQLHNLKLCNICVLRGNEREIVKGNRLNGLILDKYTFSLAAHIAEIFRPKVLALNWKPQRTFEVSDSAVHFLEHVRAKFVLIGPLFVAHFKSSELSDYVNMQGNYYLFRNKRGVAIPKVEFEEFMDVTHSETISVPGCINLLKLFSK